MNPCGRPFRIALLIMMAVQVGFSELGVQLGDVGRILVLMLAVTAVKYGVSAETGDSAGAEAGAPAAQRCCQCGRSA